MQISRNTQIAYHIEAVLHNERTTKPVNNFYRCLHSPEMRPPLHSNNPLIIAHEAVTTQTPTEEKLTRQESKESLASDHSSVCDPEDEWLSQVRACDLAAGGSEVRLCP